MIEENLAAVRARIASAAQAAGRTPDEVTLVAVSKTHPPESLREAIAAGATIFGENRVQEAEDKIREVGRGTAEWHLIGHLQANKARRAVQLFDVIESVDSVELAQRLDRICGEEGRASLDVLIQADLAGEETKSGCPEGDLPALINAIGECTHLRLRGLMIVPPFFENPEDARPYFARLRSIRDELVPDGELSMGMSHDLEAAISEGSTMVRIGTAIFGSRGSGV